MSSSKLRGRLLVAGIVLLTLAACSGQATAPPEPTRAPAPEPTDAPTPGTDATPDVTEMAEGDSLDAALQVWEWEGGGLAPTD